MTSTERVAHTFIVRLHLEQGKSSKAEWRGEIVHVPTQRSASFRGLPGVTGAIVRLMSDMETDQGAGAF